MRDTMERTPTPYVVLNVDEVVRNVEAIRGALSDVEIWYALKCNPHSAIVGALNTLGVGFEVASEEEVRGLVAAGVDNGRMMCLHPVKSPDFVRLLAEVGVKVMAADSRDEIDKLRFLAPACELVLRLEIQAPGSRVPLNGKFGCTADVAIELAGIARRSGLEVAGLTMHVGSQCESVKAWETAINIVAKVAARMRSEGFALRLMSLGGGLPAPYSASVPELSRFGDAFRAANLHAFIDPQCLVTIEPGRAIVASAGTLISTVVGTANRGGIPWLYLDAGIYQGLFEMLTAAGGLPLPVVAERSDGRERRYRIGGPTCDSLDVLPGIYELPELRIGERVAFRYAGAYSNTLSNHFNGFPPPQVVVTHSGARRSIDA